MNARASWALVLLVASAAGSAELGCTLFSKKSSSGSGNGAQMDAARSYFDSNVYTPMQQSCGNCHAGTGGGSVFLSATDADASYTMIENTPGLIDVPGKSALIQHVHSNVGVVLTPGFRDLLVNWLTMEANARGITDTAVKINNVEDAYAKFGQCMNFQLWNQTGMNNLPFTQTDVDGPCLGCHTFGQGSAFLAADPFLSFSKNQAFPYIQKLVVAKVDASGNFEALIPSRRFIEKANEPCPTGAKTCHPTFGLPPNIEGAVTNFVDTTLQNLQGGTCGLIPPPPTTDAGPADAGGGG